MGFVVAHEFVGLLVFVYRNFTSVLHDNVFFVIFQFFYSSFTPEKFVLKLTHFSVLDGFCLHFCCSLLRLYRVSSLLNKMCEFLDEHFLYLLFFLVSFELFILVKDFDWVEVGSL